MWWLSWLRQLGEPATQQFRVRSRLPPQSPEGRQELWLCIKIKSHDASTAASRPKILQKASKPAPEKSGWPKKIGGRTAAIFCQKRPKTGRKKKFDEKDAFFQFNLSFDYKFSFQIPLKWIPYKDFFTIILSIWGLKIIVQKMQNFFEFGRIFFENWPTNLPGTWQQWMRGVQS
jgi:hypothetical protein